MPDGTIQTVRAQAPSSAAPPAATPGAIHLARWPPPKSRSATSASTSTWKKTSPKTSPPPPLKKPPDIPSPPTAPRSQTTPPLAHPQPQPHQAVSPARSPPASPAFLTCAPSRSSDRAAATTRPRHLLQRLLRRLLRLRHWIQRQALFVVRHRLIQLAQPPSRLGQRQVRLRIIVRQRNRIRRPLINPLEVAIVLIEPRHPQGLRPRADQSSGGNQSPSSPAPLAEPPQPSLPDPYPLHRLAAPPSDPAQEVHCCSNCSSRWSYSPNSPHPSAAHSPSSAGSSPGNGNFDAAHLLASPTRTASPRAALASPVRRASPGNGKLFAGFHSAPESAQASASAHSQAPSLSHPRAFFSAGASQFGQTPSSRSHP